MTIETSSENRQQMTKMINAMGIERDELQDLVSGPVWDTTQLLAEFEVISFLAPYCIVKRKTDGVEGTLTFQHSPRYYFTFAPEESSD